MKARSSKENPLPEDFVWDASMLVGFNCEGCGCKETVVRLDRNEDTKKPQNKYNGKFAMRVLTAKDKGGPMPRKRPTPR